MSLKWSLDKGLIKNTRDLPFGLKSIIWTAAAVIYINYINQLNQTNFS